MRYKDCPEDYAVDEQYIYDEEEDRYYFIDHGMDEITALLNKKEEENKILKKELEAMMDILDYSGIQYHISDELEFCLD